MALEMDGEIKLKGYATETGIQVKTNFVGWHHWPDAPKEVKFLSYRHRHIFNVTVFIPVSHDDRDLEFFLVKAEIDSYLNTEFHTNVQGIKELGTNSCEMICKKIGNHITGVYHPKFFRVTVQEDEENSASTVFVKKDLK
jgi:hypothetical protein